MLRLAAFADEISPELDEQVRVCRDNEVTHFELRGVNHQNVLDFGPELRAAVRSRLADNGMGVVSIASPIGKVSVSEPWEPHFDRFKIAVELAEYFEAPFIRVFSYYPPPAGADGPDHKQETLRRFRAKVDYLKGRSVTMVHENEKGIYGDVGVRCVELMKAIDSRALRSAFDFANFVQVGDRPSDAWPGLRPYVSHIHIKDALFDGGRVVLPGAGDGNIGPILESAYKGGYRGFLSLEPHLKVAGHSHGETGPELFKAAADALKALCAKHGIPLAGA